MGFLPAAPANWDIVWRLALCGIGFGLFQTPNNIAMMTAGPVERSGAASGMNAVARYVGWALGSALVALIFGFGGARATVSCLETGAAFARSWRDRKQCSPVQVELGIGCVLLSSRNQLTATAVLASDANCVVSRRSTSGREMVREPLNKTFPRSE